jgi:hypothetical protein
LGVKTVEGEDKRQRLKRLILHGNWEKMQSIGRDQMNRNKELG